MILMKICYTLYFFSTFSSEHAFKEHRKTHVTSETVSCKESNNKFPSQTVLEHHVSTHNSTEPYECPFCRKRFTSLIICREHIDTHEEIAVQVGFKDE